MASKQFKATTGIRNWEISENIITAAITNNTANTIDTLALNSFYSVEYNITIVQGSKIRTSAVLVHTDGTSVDSTEYGIVTTGGVISGVAITATTSGSNMLLQVTITDAATTIARVRAVKNLLGVIQPYAPSAPVIGTVTASGGSVSVPFTAPLDNGLSPVTSYRVTSTSGVTATGTSSPISLTETVQGTYTYNIIATNEYGISVVSNTSNSVTISLIVKVGYLTGGSSRSSAIQKLLFSNDTISTITATTAVPRNGSGSLSNSGTAGYIAGGNSAVGTRSDIEKLLYSNEVRSTISATLSTTKFGVASFTNSGTAGYIAGSSNNTNVIEKLLFSTESVSTISATTSNSIAYPAAMANSGTAGYIAGGYRTSPSFSLLTTVDKIVFSNDSRSTLATGLSKGTYWEGAFANSGTAGYFAGGDSSPRDGFIDKFIFSNDSRSTLSATLISSRYGHTGMANSGIAGYFAGGNNGSTTTNAIDKLLFSNDTISTISSTLLSAQTDPSSFANSGTL